MKVGTSTLKLNRVGRDNAKGKAAKKGQKKGKKSGKTRAVVGEAMEERRGKDIEQGGSIDHTRSHLNEYWVCDEIVEWAGERGVSPTSADTIVDWCEERIEEYSETVFRPKVGRGVAEDAIQMLGLIVKPPARDIAGWSPEKTATFFELSGAYFDEAFGGRRNLVAVARHLDEGFEDVHTHVFYVGEHEHRFYMPWTEDGRLCAKEVHGTGLWKKLNKGYAAFMNEHGFPEVEATEILDYDEIVRLDGEIAEAEAAGDEETAQAKRDEKEAMRAEAYATRLQHRQERGGLAPGAPATAYRGMRDAQAQRDVAVAEMEDAKEKAGNWADHVENLAAKRDIIMEQAKDAGRRRDEALDEADAIREDAATEMAAAAQSTQEAAFEAEVMLHEASKAAGERDAAYSGLEKIALATKAAEAARDKAVAERDAAIADAAEAKEASREAARRDLASRKREAELERYADELKVCDDSFDDYMLEEALTPSGLRRAMAEPDEDGESVDDALAESGIPGIGQIFANLASKLVLTIHTMWMKRREERVDGARKRHAQRMQDIEIEVRDGMDDVDGPRGLGRGGGRSSGMHRDRGRDAHTPHRTGGRGHDQLSM